MSLKKNFIYSSILTVSNYLFPLIVYPYISRTLGLSNIGVVNFVDNLVNYFVLISMMGITTVGVREIAAAHKNRKKLSKTFMSLLMLTAISTIIAIIILGIVMYTVPTLFPYRSLLYVGIVKLVFNLFLVEWFFMGLEEFKYITTRSILVKCAYVLSVFLIVKEAADYKIYYILTVSFVVINAVINLFYSRHFIYYSLRDIHMRPFFKPYMIMGVYSLMTNAYIMLNPVWLGFVTNTDEVGYFTTATRLHTIISAVLLSFANILFPRVSNLLAEGKQKEFWDKINIAFDAIFLFAFPTIVYMLVAGPDLLHLVVGNGFEGAYLPLRIITPLALIIGIEQILVIQILMATHQDSTVLQNSIIGAVTALIFNILLTTSLGAVGSAIVWVIVELVVMTLSIIAIYRKYNYILPFKRVFSYCISYTPLLLLSLLLYYNLDNTYAIISVIAVLTIVYAAINESFILKNKVVCQLLQSIGL
ncbi:MAG: oligosaccharide flippase family protein [Prevotella sp.]|nr:oligosaccharide flippase family protein [Prevotella sp.]